MSTTLEALAEAARRRGWAVGSGAIGQVQAEGRSLGWTEVPARKGDPPVTTLRPVGRSQARPNSMSSQYGLDAQPLHTDGAHLTRPPDVVVLISETTNSTPTRLWRPWLKGPFSPGIPERARHGIFLVQSGKDSFFSAAYSPEGFRYDPGCMTPCDARARETVTFFRDAAEEAADHVWDQPGMMLVIDNRHTLHGRASAVDDPQRELQRVSFHVKREVS